MKSLIPWLYLAAAGNFAYAADGLDAYRQGNYTTAAKLLTMQSGKDPVMDYYLGRMTLYGYGQLKNNASALRYFTQAANKGFLPAQQLLARYYLLGAKDPEQALFWFKKAAVTDTSAQMYCASAYLNGYGVKKNSEAARHYYLDAAKNGDALAQYTLGMQFMESRNSSNKKLGTLWVIKAAAQNNPKALLELGQMYAEGHFSAKDPVKAKEYMEKSAQQNYLPALLALGDAALKHGDFTTAKTWFTKAADTQNPAAKTALGKFLLNTANPLHDYKAGFLEILQTAQSGYQEAQQILSSLYLEGKGVEADKNLAEEWQAMAKKSVADAKPIAPDIATARWLSNDKSDNLAQAGYALGGIYNAWQNPLSLKENSYNQAPQMEEVTRNSLYKPQFTIAKPNQIAISEYFDILAPMLNSNAAANWTYPRYPVDRQMHALLRKDSKVLRHEQGISIIDDGASYLQQRSQPGFDYLEENSEGWEDQANLQAVLSEMYGQAILGNPAAQFELGQLYQYGIALEKNIPQAIIYYQLAAIQQDIRAEYNLGLLYLEGLTTPVNYQKGIEWMTDAAFKGNAYAQYVLANIYENGLKDANDVAVVAPNHEQAMAMYYLASANNFGDAEYRLADYLVRENKGGLSVAAKENRTSLIRRLYNSAAKQGVVEAVLPLAFYQAMDTDPVQQRQAFDVASKEAQAGNSEAALLLGVMYARGITVPANEPEALRWYQQAAANPVSTFILGTYYGEGITGLDKNSKKSRELLQQSADSGFSYANLNLAVFKQQANEYFLVDLDKARQEGNSKAGLLLADYYLSTAVNTEKMEESRNIYKYFADKGDKDAQLKLGFLYERGLGGTADMGLALQWYSSAAEQGQPVAQYLLGHLNQLGKTGKGQPDYAEAKKWYKAAQTGYAPASVALGFIFETVEDNYQQAFENYTLAANAGDTVGRFNLGLMYEYGKGTPVNLTKAKILFADAAKQGYSKAMTQLAGLYFEGTEGNRDEQQALAWYQQAAGAGDSTAMYQLGLLSETGVATQLDFQNAVKYYQQASNAGNEKAKLALARMYQYGLGVKKDYKHAAQLYKELAADNNAYAQYQLALLYFGGLLGEHTPDQTSALLQQAKSNGSLQADRMLQWMNAQKEPGLSFIEPIAFSQVPSFTGLPAEMMYLEALNEWNRGDEDLSRVMLNQLMNKFPDYVPAKRTYEQLKQAKASI